MRDRAPAIALTRPSSLPKFSAENLRVSGTVGPSHALKVVVACRHHPPLQAHVPASKGKLERSTYVWLMKLNMVAKEYGRREHTVMNLRSPWGKSSIK